MRLQPETAAVVFAGRLLRLRKAVLPVVRKRLRQLQGPIRGGARTGHPFLDRAMDLVSKLRYSLEGRPEWWPPAPLVNPSNGNVVLQIWTPLGGPADPRVVLTYNSWSPEESEYGYGSSNSLNRWVAGGNIVHAGDGAIFYYESANYTPPAGAQHAGLPRGLQRRRDPARRLPDALRNHRQADEIRERRRGRLDPRWSRGDRIYAVIDPFNRRTSIVYGGSDKIQRWWTLMAGHHVHRGRLRGFGEDDESRAVRDGVPLRRQSSTDRLHRPGREPHHVFVRRRQPLGRVNPTPDGQRVTYLWDESRRARIIDPSANATSAASTGTRNIPQVGGPLGQVTTCLVRRSASRPTWAGEGARTTVFVHRRTIGLDGWRI